MEHTPASRTAELHFGIISVADTNATAPKLEEQRQGGTLQQETAEPAALGFTLAGALSAVEEKPVSSAQETSTAEHSFSTGSSFKHANATPTKNVSVKHEGADSFSHRDSTSFSGGLNPNSRLIRSSSTVRGMLASADGLGAISDRALFHQEVQQTRKRLRTMAWRTVNPNSARMKWWDLVLISSLLFTAIVTPFHLAFIEYSPDVTKAPIDFTTNRIVDAVFAFDIVLQFFLPYREKSGQMIYDNRKITRAYLKGWFALDVFTTVPWDTLVALVAHASRWETKGKLFRLLRMLRCLKLMRIMRASRIINRWQNHIAISFAVTSLIKFIFITVILTHWLACYWGYLGVEADEPWEGYDVRGMSWRQKAGIGTDATPLQLYGVCSYTALGIIVGGSLFTPPGNYLEFYAAMFSLALGSSVWAYVIGSACGIIATLDPARIQHQQIMDELTLFCKENAIPPDLRVKLRSYFRNSIRLMRSQRYEALLQRMSTRLRGDAAYRMCEFRLRSVPFLVDPDIEPEFMCNLAIKFSTAAYSRLERVPCNDLFIVDRGVVAKLGRLYLAGTCQSQNHTVPSAGSCLGLDVILSSDRLRDMSDSISLCFTQTWSLSQKTIFELLPDYPQAYRIVRKSAMRMALSRAMKRAADLLRASDKWRVGRPEYSFLAVFDEAMQLASDVGPISHDDWKKRAAEAGSKMSGLRLLQRDDLKPPTVDDQMRALHAKVDDTTAIVNSRMDKLEVCLLAISAKLDRPASMSFVKRQKSRSRGLLAGASATAAAAAEATPMRAAVGAADAAAAEDGVGGLPGNGRSMLRSALPSSRQELREDSASANASYGSPFEA